MIRAIITSSSHKVERFGQDAYVGVVSINRLPVWQGMPWLDRKHAKEEADREASRLRAAHASGRR